MPLNIKDLVISSPQLAPGAALGDENAYDKGNIAPPLQIAGVPADAVELALIAWDPDAPLPGGYTHWTLYGIPADTLDIGPDSDKKFRPGPNGWGEHNYGGPRPPDGHGPHHYYFWIFALRRPVEGTPSREAFLAQYADAIVEQNRVVFVYER